MAESASATVTRTCPLCEATCGLELDVAGGRITGVRGDRHDVFSHGYLCPKGAVLGDLEADPDRVRRPLVRHDGALVETSWDAAYTAVAAGLGAVLDGPDRDAVGLYLGNPNVHNLAGAFYVRPLAKALGTRNVFSASTLDQMPKHVACGHLFGDPLAIPVPDLDRTEHLVVLGANPRMSNGSLCTAPDFPGRLDAIRARGGRVVVVDPRRTRTAAAADEWVPIRPGGDPFLLAAMACTLFEEGLVAPGPAAAHLAGVEAVGAAVRRFAPEAVETATGIDADTTRRLARGLAAAGRGAVYGRIGTHTVPFGTLAAWLVDVVNALTGNLDRPGGAMFPRPAHRPAALPAREYRTGRWTSRVRGLPEVNGELPTATLVDEIETPGEARIRALVTVAGNPVLSAPDSERLDAALGSLDFMVSVDPYVNATTRHADVVLPPEPLLARPHYALAFYGLSVRNVANFSPPAVPLPDEAHPEWRTLLRLAQIAGGQGPHADPAELDELVAHEVARTAVSPPASPAHGTPVSEALDAVAPLEGPERLLDLLLRSGAYGDGFGRHPAGLTLDELRRHPHGLDLGPLEPRLPEILRNPSGTVELAPPTLVADLDRLWGHRGAHADGPVLVGRRHVRSNNSWMHNVAALRRGRELCTLQVHPRDATAHGLTDGGEALVGTSTGRVRVRVEVTDELRPGVVSLPHGYGHDRPGVRQRVATAHPGVSSNVLTDGEVDPLSGNAVLNGIAVELAPAGEDQPSVASE